MELILICKNCENEITNPVRKGQKFCSGEICSKLFHNRAYKRRYNNSKPENYWWGKKK